jgi:HK97 family phage prohead protease
MDRAFAIFDVKAVDDDARTIEGIASTPTPDRMNDIVEPLGAEFKLPLPLLWQHDRHAPVGHVEFAKAEKTGIPFRARLAKITEDGPLKTIVDTAWQAVKAKLVRGVSIGFRPKELAFIEATGGIRFLEWEWLELSLVTIPANADASIDRIKAISVEQMAASGRSAPAASGTPARIVTLTKSERNRFVIRNVHRKTNPAG